MGAGFSVVTYGPGTQVPVCGECGQIDRPQKAMAQARGIIRRHADAEHMGMGETIHDNRLADDTGEVLHCLLPLDMCPHLADDPPLSAIEELREKLANTPKQEKEQPTYMSTDSQFKRIVVYVPIEVAISAELAEENDHEATVADLLKTVVADTLLEPESVAEHDPFAIVGVSGQTTREPNTLVWTRILPDEDKGIAGTVDNGHTYRLADVGSMESVTSMSRAFEQSTKCLTALLKDGKLDPMCKVRLVLELQVPEREPAHA